MAATLLIACFWAWRDERLQVEHLHVDKLSMTPKELVQIYNGRTTGQGEKLAAGYTGKWIEVAGIISDMRFYPNGMFWKRARVVISDSDFPTNYPAVGATFIEKWTEPLSVLRPGERIKALGQIKQIEKHWVWLEECELIEVINPMPTPTPSPTPEALPSPSPTAEPTPATPAAPRKRARDGKRH